MMNYHTVTIASDVAERQKSEAAQEAAHARTLAARLNEYADLIEDRGKPTPMTEHALLGCLNAAIDWIDDGDFLTAREHLIEENRWDEYGNPLDANREPILGAARCVLHPDGSSEMRAAS